MEGLKLCQVPIKYYNIRNMGAYNKILFVVCRQSLKQLHKNEINNVK